MIFHSKLLVNQRVYTWPVHDVDFTTVNDWIYHVDVCMLMLSVYMMSKSDTYITKYVNTITVSTHITSHKNTSCIWYYTTRMCIYLYILYSKPKKCQKCTILLLLNTDQSLPYLFGDCCSSVFKKTRWWMIVGYHSIQYPSISNVLVDNHRLWYSLLINQDNEMTQSGPFPGGPIAWCRTTLSSCRHGQKVPCEPWNTYSNSP